MAQSRGNASDSNDNTTVVLKNDSNVSIGQNSTNPVHVTGNTQLVPNSTIIHALSELTNVTHGNDQTQDGSVTEIVYSTGPGAGEIWYITEINFQIADGGNAKITDWGGITNGLTNGLLIEQTINSTDYEMLNLKQNKNILEFFNEDTFAGGRSGFITNSNFFSGAIQFPQPVTLIGDDSDMIKATVRDDLTVLDLQVMAVQYFRVL